MNMRVLLQRVTPLLSFSSSAQIEQKSRSIAVIELLEFDANGSGWTVPIDYSLDATLANWDKIGEMKVMSDWYIAFDGEAIGPYSASQLKERAARGEITPDTQICKADSDRWTPASSLKGLFPVADAPVSTQADASQLIPNVVVMAPTAAAPSIWTRFGRLIGSAIFICIISTIAAGIIFATSRKLTSIEDELKELKLQKVELEDEMESERGRIKNERRILESDRQAIEESKRGLIQEKEQLKKDIQNLTSMRDDLKAWQKMDVVMINPGSIAVGLLQGAGSELVMRKIARDGSASQASAPVAIATAIKGGHAQFISANPKLTRDIAASFNVGDVVTGTLRKELSRYWNNTRIVDVASNDDMTCISFLDASTLSRRIGLFVAADESSVTFHEAGHGKQQISRKLIVPGSAIRGTINRILPLLDELSIIDQACLRVAQAVQSPDGAFLTHNINVQVSPEVPNYENFWKNRKREYTAGGFRSNYPLIDLAVQGSILFANNSIITKENDLLDEHRKILSAIEDARIRIVDDVISRLIKTGLTVMSRDQEEHLVETLALAGVPWDTKRQFGLPVSHRLHIKVQPPVKGTRCRLVVSLHDNRTNSLIFSENTDPLYESIYDDLPSVEKLRDRSFTLTSRTREYFLDSGQLAVLKVKKSAVKSFHPVELPARVKRTNESTATSTSCLVYLESPEGTFPVKYRPLFEKRRYELDKTDFESIKFPLDPDDKDTNSDTFILPRSDIFRYFACRIARKTMPSAGRIRSIDNTGVVISVDRETGLSVGSTARLLRYFDKDYRSVLDEFSGKESEAFLPILLKVSEVHDRHCKAQVIRSGFEDVWPEDYELQEGDIVVPIVQRRPVIGVLPPLGINPERKSSAGKAITNALLEANAIRDAMDIARRFAREMSEALRSINIATKEITSPYGPQRDASLAFLDKNTLQYQIDAMRQAGATHVVVGFLQPKTSTSYDFRIGILPADYRANADAVIADSVNFHLSSSLIPK